jgi:hypothetical protein
MIRPAHLAAALLPLAGLAVLWGWSDYRSRQGTEWEVPIQGYDPRDYLRGRYVEFAYDWPGLEENAFIAPGALCLEGVAPRIDRVILPAAGTSPCAHPLVADEGGVYGISALSQGRLYVGQDRAAALEEELRKRNQRGIVRIRQREDGSFTPVAIRFRPMTAAEITERDAEDAARAEQGFEPPEVGEE